MIANRRFLIIFVLKFNFVYARPLSCAADKFADGCSVPPIIPAPFKNEFTSACNRHDICYACGTHYNWSRSDCDMSFYNNMKEVCSQMKEKRSFWGSVVDLLNNIGSKANQCRTAAKVYFEAVRLFAESHFDKHDHDYCLAKCAENHGNPFDKKSI
ncbi:conodipine-P2 [Hydra vulgaris]|uniref:conodipine-P2 n=1 Tax=Hydra vulgaris TaxID=6087 RepID=UPI001F5EFF67|nr:conodipine-P2-like isoform X1 [Hydra vulgaris]